MASRSQRFKALIRSYSNGANKNGTKLGGNGNPQRLWEPRLSPAGGSVRPYIMVSGDVACGRTKKRKCGDRTPYKEEDKELNGRVWCPLSGVALQELQEHRPPPAGSGARLQGCADTITNRVIGKSKLLQILYRGQRGIFGGDFDISTSLERTWKSKLHDLAIGIHRSTLHTGSVDIYQWKGHSDGIDRCKMKMGLVLTGGSGKVMRLWSVERYKCLAEYFLPQTGSLIDFNFDESKVVGLVGNHICLWRRNERRSIFSSQKGQFPKSSCMCYVDPEAVVGCEDGRARVFDMYGRKWSRIIKMHNGPVTCLSFSDDQLLIGGSSFGHISLSDLSSDQQVATLKNNDFADLTTLCYNSRSHIVFSGSRSGRASSWDLRMMKQLWEVRVSPNFISSIQHMRDDTSILAVGGIDGVLRLVDQQNGEFLSNCIIYESSRKSYRSETSHSTVARKKGLRVSEDARFDLMPRISRPSISCLAVGMKKVVTTHADGYIRVWKFSK